MASNRSGQSNTVVGLFWCLQASCLPRLALTHQAQESEVNLHHSLFGNGVRALLLQCA